MCENKHCQWHAVWNTKLQGRCKGRKLSSLYLQIFIVKKHLAYSFIVQAVTFWKSAPVEPSRQHRYAALIQTFQKLQLFCTAWYDVESKYKKRALPEANGNWTAKALIIWQWVKVLSYSCKTTKFNWIPKMCSNRTMCGKFRMSFFKLFYFKGRMELGWNQRRTTQVLRQVCLSHSSLFLLQRKHIHIHYCTVHLPMCNNTAV